MEAMFAAKVASLTLAMTSEESTIELLHKICIFPSFRTCSTRRDTKPAFFLRSFIDFINTFSFLPQPKQHKKTENSSTKLNKCGRPRTYNREGYYYTICVERVKDSCTKAQMFFLCIHIFLVL